MTVNVHTRTIVTLDVDALDFLPELDFTPVEWIDPVVTKREDGTYTVAYAVLDTDPGGYSPLDDDEAITFKEFTTEWDRDDFIASFDTDKYAVFVVDHYEHSGHHYSLAGTVAYHHGAWDTRPSCVLVLDKSVIGGDADFDYEAAAKSWLSEYNSWVSGDVYGIVRQDFTAEGDVLGDTEHVWGFIGTEYAEQAVADIDGHL